MPRKFKKYYRYNLNIINEFSHIIIKLQEKLGLSIFCFLIFDFLILCSYSLGLKMSGYNFNSYIIVICLNYSVGTPEINKTKYRIVLNLRNQLHTNESKYLKIIP